MGENIGRQAQCGFGGCYLAYDSDLSRTTEPSRGTLARWLPSRKQSAQCYNISLQTRFQWNFSLSWKHGRDSHWRYIFTFLGIPDNKYFDICALIHNSSSRHSIRVYYTPRSPWLPLSLLYCFDDNHIPGLFFMYLCFNPYDSVFCYLRTIFICNTVDAACFCADSFMEEELMGKWK